MLGMFIKTVFRNIVGLLALWPIVVHGKYTLTLYEMKTFFNRSNEVLNNPSFYTDVKNIHKNLCPEKRLFNWQNNCPWREEQANRKC
jgi:hypothetical protein